MAKVTIHWKSGGTTSFETHDPKTIARYESYADTDPNIKRITIED